ncbi:hypothetical protein ACRAWF_44755 [Streptomyces sp. L7]
MDDEHRLVYRADNKEVQDPQGSLPLHRLGRPRQTDQRPCPLPRQWIADIRARCAVPR